MSTITTQSVIDAYKKMQENPPALLFQGYEIKVLKSNIFPYQSTYNACDVETKEEIKVTGEMVDGVVLGNTMYLSSKAYDTLKQNDK